MEPNKTSSDAKQDTSITTTEVRAETYQPPGAGHVKAKGFRKWLQRFFPWVGETTTSQLNAVHKRSSFPWYGLVCLIGALLTMVLSFLILHFIDGRPEITSKYLKPASWLSAILSLNGILLSQALAEGVTTAWWYRASRPDVTLEQLHTTWRLGTSKWAILSAGKSFNYVALAGIFVATVPLNGFLLQAAIAYEQDTHANLTTLYIPVSQQLPLGYSASVVNGTLGDWSDGLSSAASSMDGLSGGSVTLPPGVSYIAGSSFDLVGCTNKDNSAVCKTSVTIPGFSMSCTSEMSEEYDLRPSQHVGSKFTANVYSSSVTWNAASPNTIGLDLIYKPNATCQGRLEHKKCILTAASMSMPIQVNSDQGYYVGTQWNNAAYSYPVISIDQESTVVNYTAHEPLPVPPNEGKENSTYGGIAKWLGQRFNGSIDWTLQDGSWSTSRTGPVTYSYSLNTQLYSTDKDGNPIMWADESNPGPLDFNPKPNNESWCQNTYSGLDWMADLGNASYYGSPPSDNVFTTVNRLMLSISAAQGTQDWSDLQSDETLSNLWYNDTKSTYDEFWNPHFRKMAVTVPKSQETQSVLFYRIRYGYWGASVAITVTIVLMVVPLFYGFWQLDRRTTLSPFETAAAFRAPGLQGVDLQRGADVALQAVGKKPLHADVSISSFDSRR
ncbi:hypothetical protein LTR64_007993 [Lithohypha guttulata]|uniref:uncharacterized protein n=1 Tax=Lithohypha guttulata TaxID=1690604 RepID=UPI002DE19B77|nr:hypothetical protein LTR51_008138 [Lithohypha guttulata]